MDLADNNIRKYTWNPKWEIPYESAWSRIEKFRLANQISITRRIITLSTHGNGPIIYDPQYHIYKCGYYIIKLKEEQLKLDHSNYGIFDNYELITDKRLRYCPECIKYGYHSVFHQMRVFDFCVFHPHLKLKYMCDCGCDSYVLHLKPINKYRGYQCSGCGSLLPMPMVEEGICGKWEYDNLAFAITKWKNIWDKRLEDRIKIKFINICDKDRSPSDVHIYNSFKKIIREYLFTGEVKSSPVFQYCDRLKLNQKSMPDMLYWYRVFHRFDKEYRLKGVHSVCKYIDSNIERDIFRKTYNEIVKADSKIPGIIPFDKSNCDPESAILLFLLKKLRNGMIVRDTKPLDTFDDIVEKNIFTKYLDTAICSGFMSEFLHVKTFNYIYAKYIERYYDYLKQCFLYDLPCEFPKTACDEVRDDMCVFPTYLMFDNKYIVYLYKGSG